MLEELFFIIRLDPEARDAVMAAVGMALRVNAVQQARQYLINWLRDQPADTGARRALEDIDRQIQEQSLLR